MERRAFMQGILAAIAGREAVVRLATDEEVASLTLREPAFLSQPKKNATATTIHTFLGGEEIYVKKDADTYACIGHLTGFESHMTPIDITSAWDSSQRLVKGPIHWTGTFEGGTV